jgi:uncharacterized membrane-anchored protein YjiN (DUF445 family)
MKLTKGNTSLLIVLTGFLVLLVLLQQKVVAGWEWELLLAGFEAATVGALADWFAVSALFYKIPIPILGKHTNIIVQKRDKISNSIVDLVTNEWLAPKVIRAKLSGISLLDKLWELIEAPAMKQKIAQKTRWALQQVVPMMDSEAVKDYLQKVLKTELEKLDLSTQIGKWLRDAVSQNKHLPACELLLDKAGQLLTSDESQEKMRLFLEEKFKEKSEEGLMTSVFLKAATTFGGLDSDSLRKKITDSLLTELENAKINPDHTIRVQIENMLLTLAKNLQTQDSSEQKRVAEWEQYLQQKISNDDVIKGLLGKLKNNLEADLNNEDSTILNWISNALSDLVQNFRNDTKQQASLEEGLKEMLLEVIDKNHTVIGETVRGSLNKLDNVALVEQIQDKVGDDLEYIRLNGAIIGGLVGVILSAIKMLII